PGRWPGLGRVRRTPATRWAFPCRDRGRSAASRTRPAPVRGPRATRGRPSACRTGPDGPASRGPGPSWPENACRLEQPSPLLVDDEVADVRVRRDCLVEVDVEVAGSRHDRVDVHAGSPGLEGRDHVARGGHPGHRDLPRVLAGGDVGPAAPAELRLADDVERDLGGRAGGRLDADADKGRRGWRCAGPGEPVDPGFGRTTLA